MTSSEVRPRSGQEGSIAFSRLSQHSHETVSLLACVRHKAALGGEWVSHEGRRDALWKYCSPYAALLASLACCSRLAQAHCNGDAIHLESIKHALKSSTTQDNMHSVQCEMVEGGLAKQGKDRKWELTQRCRR